MKEEAEKKPSLEEIFGVAPATPKLSQDIVPFEGEVIEGTIEQVQDEVDQDFQEARENLKEIAEISKGALGDLAYIAKDSEQPRSYDALSKLISAAVIANKAVVEIHKNRKEGRDEEGEGGQTTINNNLYMTTAEFAQRLEQLENDDEEEKE